ncbi:MAG: sugar transferase [Patescibacteria group bacterium]
MKKSELIFSAILIPVDYFAVFAAGLFAYYLRFQSPLITEIRPVFYEMSLQQYILILAGISILWLAIFALAGLYNIQGTRKAIDELAKIFVACSTAIMLIIIIIFFKREFFSSRFIILSGWVLSIIFVSLVRILVRALQHALFRRSVGTHNVLVIGSDRTADEIIREISIKPGLGYKLAGRFDNFDEEKLKQAASWAQNKAIDEVIQAENNLPREDVLRLIDLCNDYHLIFKYAAGISEAQTVHLEVNTMAGIPIVEVKRTPLDGWGKIIKRTLDFIFSLLFLMVLSPVFLIVALAVKLDSSGPVFVRLERIGEAGRPFILFKFRSMIRNAHEMKKNLIALNERNDGPLFKIKNDPRITRVGRFIRKTSLDELPQLYNVLRGEMSLVGPRPHEPEEVAKYEKHQRKLLAIKPGLTGLAQISGRSDLKFDEEAKLDTYYIENWSLNLDLQIIIKTPLVVFSGKSAG